MANQSHDDSHTHDLSLSMSMADDDPQTSRPPATKISCLACRSAKRKCSSNDVHTVCSRCKVQGLACEYRKHERGRRKRPRAEDPEEAVVGDVPQTISPSMIPIGPSKSNASVVSMHSGPDGVSPASTSGGDRLRPPSQRKIQFSHLVPEGGDSSHFLPSGRAAGSPGNAAATSPIPPTPRDDADEQYALVERLLHTQCKDPIDIGLISEADAVELFDFYFRYLNVTIAMLDEQLHNPPMVCRQRSQLLFTAVVAVASRIVKPKVYLACLFLANKLVGHAVETGECTIEVVQALNILAQWKRGDDFSSWRRVGYAIRMAQELRLNVRSSRPLPPDDLTAREILNCERTWLNLIIADYHLAIHHSLPRIMSGDDGGTDDPVQWIKNDHPSHLAARGEAVLAPMIEFSRMCRLWADSLAGISGHPSNLRILGWIEMQWKRWQTRWVPPVDNSSPTTGSVGIQLEPQQVSTLRMCDAYYQFHIAEYRLLYFSKKRERDREGLKQQQRQSRERSGSTSDSDEHAAPLSSTFDMTPLFMAFGDCVDKALYVTQRFLSEIAEPGYMRYAFNLCWISLSVSLVWLIKNIQSISEDDTMRVEQALRDVQTVVKKATRSKNDLPAYTDRLVEHLLGRLNEARLGSLADAAAAIRGDGNGHPPEYGIGQSPLGQGKPFHGMHHQQPHSMGTGTPSASLQHAASAQQLIQDDLWTAAHLMSSTPTSGLLGLDPHFRMGGTNSGTATPFAMHLSGNGFPQQHQFPNGTLPSGGTRSGAGSFASHDPLFPRADDEFWRMLFPVQSGPQGL